LSARLSVVAANNAAEATTLNLLLQQKVQDRVLSKLGVEGSLQKQPLAEAHVAM
jgi:hypothetical protein